MRPSDEALNAAYATGLRNWIGGGPITPHAAGLRAVADLTVAKLAEAGGVDVEALAFEIQSNVGQGNWGRAAIADAIRTALAQAEAQRGQDVQEPTREHYKSRLNTLLSDLLDAGIDSELMDGGWRIMNRDAERLDFILPLLELAEGDGNAVATRIGGALLLGLTGREAIDTAMRERGKEGAK